MTIGIRNCAVQFRRLCPMTWEGLQPTADDTVRLCEGCWRHVFLCTTAAEAFYHAMEGHCIAMVTPSGSAYVGEPMG